MHFTSYEFIGFLLVLTIFYYTIFKKLQWPLLLVANVFFYVWAGYQTSIFIFITAITVFFAAKALENSNLAQKQYLKEHKEELDKEAKTAYKASCQRKRNLILTVTVAFNLCILIVLKYVGFFLQPLGISFYTLMAIGYLIDINRASYEAEKNVLRFITFTTFFPVVIQGPISKYNEVAPSMFKEHTFDTNQFMSGMLRIMWGFFKKLIVADRIGIAVSLITGDSCTYAGGYVLVGMLFYTCQLYADFTGGIDVTIGVAKILGINLSENFLRPYFSVSLKEYWRRWHITMCQWFRTYVFYPVSTSKTIQNISKALRSKGHTTLGKKLPVHLSSLIVWTLTGVWHGANFNFLVWGLLNFFILMISEELDPLYTRFHGRFGFSNTKGYKIFAMLRTFLLICVLNLFDCYKTVGETLGAIASVFTSKGYSAISSGALMELGLSGIDYIIIAIGVAVMFVVSLIQEHYATSDKELTVSSYVKLVLTLVLFICVIMFGAYSIGYDSSQFIYNQF